MVKTYLKPLFKRHFGLFASMAAVSMLAISLMVSFITSIANLGDAIKDYRDEYGSADGVIETSLIQREELQNLTSLPEVADAQGRIVTYAMIEKPDKRVITSRVLSYHDNDEIYKLYYESKAELSTPVDLCMETVYARNNGFNVGDVVRIGYFGFYIDCRVGALVKTPESMYIRAEDFIWSDNIDFGYVYLNEALMGDILMQVKYKIEEKIAENPEYEAIYEELMKTLGPSLPDIRTIGNDFVAKMANQILLKAAPGVEEQALIDSVSLALKNQSITVTGSKLGSETPAVVYMNRCTAQLQVAAVFLPVFFFGVALLVIALFINQILKSMTAEIGTMVSIGVAPSSITGLFSVFILIMSAVAIVFGFAIGYGLLSYLLTTFLSIYNLPAISFGLPWYVVVMAIVLTVGVGQAAVAICSSLIYRITPKDAMLSNETKRKPLPQGIQKVIEKLPTVYYIGVNSMLQNKRRFFVSVFSMIAAFMLVALTTNFLVSKGELIGQTMSYRMAYDVQTYVTGELSEDFETRLKNEPSVVLYEVVDYTYLPVIKPDGKLYHLQSMGVGTDRTDLVVIPDSTGKGNMEVPNQGIILAELDATALGVSVGDSVKINGRDLEIKGISRQYTNGVSYVSHETMQSLGVLQAVSILAKVSDENAYSAFIQDEGIMAISVFTSKLYQDFNSRLKGADVMVYILIGFAFVMGFAILAIMSQNALMEQKKPLSIMRAIGFNLMRISNLWTLQSISQLLAATIIAFPASIGATIALFSMASSSSQVYPFIFSFPVYAMAFGFVLLIIVLTHLIAMRSIAKWNLADNTRTRE